MNAKTTTVTLVANGVTRDFEFSHAENILRLPRTNWRLPKDSEFEFKNNALQRRGNKKKGNGK